MEGQVTSDLRYRVRPYRKLRQFVAALLRESLKRLADAGDHH
jgi:hypothetical protein